MHNSTVRSRATSLGRTPPRKTVFRLPEGLVRFQCIISCGDKVVQRPGGSENCVILQKCSVLDSTTYEVGLGI